MDNTSGGPFQHCTAPGTPPCDRFFGLVWVLHHHHLSSNNPACTGPQRLRSTFTLPLRRTDWTRVAQTTAKHAASNCPKFVCALVNFDRLKLATALEPADSDTKDSTTQRCTLSRAQRDPTQKSKYDTHKIEAPNANQAHDLAPPGGCLWQGGGGGEVGPVAVSGNCDHEPELACAASTG